MHDTFLENMPDQLMNVKELDTNITEKKFTYTRKSSNIKVQKFTEPFSK